MTSIYSNVWIKNFILTYKWSIIDMYGTPMVPKILKIEKLKLWAFQRRINYPHILPRSKLTKFETFMILFNLKVPTKMWIFALKIHKKVKTSTKRVNTTRYPNHACDTAFESPDIILFHTNIFGYHSGTHGTQIIHFTIEYWNQRKTHSPNPQMTL